MISWDFYPSYKCNDLKLRSLLGLSAVQPRQWLQAEPGKWSFTTPNIHILSPAAIALSQWTITDFSSSEIASIAGDAESLNIFRSKIGETAHKNCQTWLYLLNLIY